MPVSSATTILGFPLLKLFWDTACRAFEIYKKILSGNIFKDISDLHRTEAYVYSQMIAGKRCMPFR